MVDNRYIGVSCSKIKNNTSNITHRLNNGTCKELSNLYHHTGYDG